MTVALACWVAGCGLVQAGEPIILPSQGSKPEPAPQQLTRKELLKPNERLPSVNPQHIEGLALPTPSGRRKKTPQEKRQQAARAERVNWLLLRPGELTDRSPADETFGLRQDDWLQDTEETDRRDYTFYGLDKPKQNSQADAKPGQSQRPAGQTQAPERRGEDFETQEQRKGASGNALVLYDKDQPAWGAHTAKELDLRGYLDTTIVDLQGKDQGRVSEGLLGGSSALIRSRAQEGRLQEFRQWLDAPKSPVMAGESKPAAKLPIELPRAPMTPPARSLPDSSVSLGSGGPWGVPPDLGGSGLSRGSTVPGLPGLDWAQPSVTRSLPTAPPSRDPMGAAPVSRPSVLRPTVLEIPSTR